MKKGLKIFSAAIALSVMMSLLTACPNDTKTSQNDDRTDLTTRQTETGLMPDMSEPNQTINSYEQFQFMHRNDEKNGRKALQ